MNSRDLAQNFEARFGNRPRIFRAPGRVNLIGEHTDYNDGFVMPAAVEFSTFVAVSPRHDRRLVVQSDELPGNFEFDLDNFPDRRTSSWCDYVLGVASAFRQHGGHLQAANLLIHGDVPIGAGLSSSAAIEVASALAFMSLDSKTLPLPQVAKLCRQAENEFVGARVGIMDQFVSCMGKAGHALLLDCRSLEFKFAPLPRGIELVVCNTMVKHDLATGAYNQRREECEQAVRFFAQTDPSIRALRDVSPELLRQTGASASCHHSETLHARDPGESADSGCGTGSGRRRPSTCRHANARVPRQPARSLRGQLPRIGRYGGCGPRITGLHWRAYDRRRIRRLHGQPCARGKCSRVRGSDCRTLPETHRHQSANLSLPRRRRGTRDQLELAWSLLGAHPRNFTSQFSGSGRIANLGSSPRTMATSSQQWNRGHA